MRTTSELTPGWRKLRAFTRLLMRPLPRAMRTKCTRLVYSKYSCRKCESNLNVNFAVCDRVSLPRDDADGEPEDNPVEFHQDLGTTFGEVFTKNNFVTQNIIRKVVQARCAEMASKDNMFGQLTVRMHTQQTLAVYDRFVTVVEYNLQKSESKVWAAHPWK